jgi:hypothetical protein
MVWIMLNPSTADHEIDDPTILACIDFAKRNGCGGSWWSTCSPSARRIPR